MGFPNVSRRRKYTATTGPSKFLRIPERSWDLKQAAMFGLGMPMFEFEQEFAVTQRPSFGVVTLSGGAASQDV
jgi:hypothetical protein